MEPEGKTSVMCIQLNNKKNLHLEMEIPGGMLISLSKFDGKYS
jgi:hypothetical protein